MKVVCKANVMDDKWRKEIGAPSNTAIYRGRLTPGNEYLVLGFWFNAKFTDLYGGRPALELLDDTGNLTTAPIQLFEISDPRASQHWTISFDSENTLSCMPEELQNDHFLDRVDDGHPEEVEMFRKVCDKLNDE